MGEKYVSATKFLCSEKGAKNNNKSNFIQFCTQSERSLKKKLSEKSLTNLSLTITTSSKISDNNYYFLLKVILLDHTILYPKIVWDLSRCKIMCRLEVKPTLTFLVFMTCQIFSFQTSGHRRNKCRYELLVISKTFIYFIQII